MFTGSTQGSFGNGMTRRLAFLVAAVLFVPACVLAAVIADVPEGPLNLPNAPQIGAAGREA